MPKKPIIVFWDEVSKKQPYDHRTFVSEAIGGTQASVIRVAEALADACDVSVIQRLRRADVQSPAGVLYSGPYGACGAHEPVHAVVAVRGFDIPPRLRRRYPEARLFLWCHDFEDASATLEAPGRALAASSTTVVAVSECHRRHLVALFASRNGFSTAPRVVRIDNPIDQDLHPDSTAVEPNTLLFCSSPHKGLDRTITIFGRALQRFPALTLEVADPGYRPWPPIDGPRVRRLGSLPFQELVPHMRRALCVFYPNTDVPETFGLVYAEANAVGTPVLAHPIGAADDVLSGAGQLLDCTDADAVVDCVGRWRAGARPRVRGRERSRIDRVKAAWLDVLDVPTSLHARRPSTPASGSTRGMDGTGRSDGWGA